MLHASASTRLVHRFRRSGRFHAPSRSDHRRPPWPFSRRTPTADPGVKTHTQTAPGPDARSFSLWRGAPRTSAARASRSSPLDCRGRVELGVEGGGGGCDRRAVPGGWFGHDLLLRRGLAELDRSVLPGSGRAGTQQFRAVSMRGPKATRGRTTHAGRARAARDRFCAHRFGGAFRRRDPSRRQARRAHTRESARSFFGRSRRRRCFGRDCWDARRRPTVDRGQRAPLFVERLRREGVREAVVREP